MSEPPHHDNKPKGIVKRPPPLCLGWQEWCQLPELRIPAIKAKVDTGAKTSAIHAEDIKAFKRQGEWFVRFNVFPIQRDTRIIVPCQARIFDQRNVMNSGGHNEKRYVIQSQLILGQKIWLIELTLTNRQPLAFRMLLGREALSGHVLIDCKRTLCQGKITGHELNSLYGPLP